MLLRGGIIEHVQRDREVLTALTGEPASCCTMERSARASRWRYVCWTATVISASQAIWPSTNASPRYL